jgi:catechol 2,3-dioxygenase-like lactoylglutathione lyase family enzyme
MTKPIGINHVALEVGSVDEALAWYGRFLDLDVNERHGDEMAFVDLGDQFLAFARAPATPPDTARHFGLVVDDKEALRRALLEAGVEVSPPPRLDFCDPWGNLVQAVDYRQVQFTKAPAVARALGVDGLAKTESARAELHAKGLLEQLEEPT